jgi:RNA polymerase-interacting CarD/CdnL/TRCF family regulator
VHELTTGKTEDGRKKQMTQQLTVGQKLVHRRYGAGIVVRVRKGREDEDHECYYVIDIPSRDLKLHLPVDGAQNMALRKLVSRRRMNRALRLLSEQPVELPRDYRERRALVTELMTDGTVNSLAQTIRDLYGLQNRKSMSTLESSMLTNAKRRLAGELALVADIELSQAMQRIEQALQKDKGD